MCSGGSQWHCLQITAYHRLLRETAAECLSAHKVYGQGGKARAGHHDAIGHPKWECRQSCGVFPVALSLASQAVVLRLLCVCCMCCAE